MANDGENKQQRSKSGEVKEKSNIDYFYYMSDKVLNPLNKTEFIAIPSQVWSIKGIGANELILYGYIVMACNQERSPIVKIVSSEISNEIPVLTRKKIKLSLNKLKELNLIDKRAKGRGGVEVCIIPLKGMYLGKTGSDGKTEKIGPCGAQFHRKEGPVGPTFVGNRSLEGPNKKEGPVGPNLDDEEIRPHRDSFHTKVGPGGTHLGVNRSLEGPIFIPEINEAKNGSKQVPGGPTLFFTPYWLNISKKCSNKSFPNDFQKLERQLEYTQMHVLGLEQVSTFARETHTRVSNVSWTLFFKKLVYANAAEVKYHPAVRKANKTSFGDTNYPLVVDTYELFNFVSFNNLVLIGSTLQAYGNDDNQDDNVLFIQDLYTAVRCVNSETTQAAIEFICIKWLDHKAKLIENQNNHGQSKTPTMHSERYWDYVTREIENEENEREGIPLYGSKDERLTLELSEVLTEKEIEDNLLMKKYNVPKSRLFELKRKLKNGEKVQQTTQPATQQGDDNEADTAKPFESTREFIKIYCQVGINHANDKEQKPLMELKEIARAEYLKQYDFNEDTRESVKIA